MNFCLDKFAIELPKVELHAHLNGSLSRETLLKLNAMKPHVRLDIPDELETLQDFFPIFKGIYQLTDSIDAVSLATRCTIIEFKNDGVKYLELRSTPRSVGQISKEHYVNACLDGSKGFNDIIVYWILSMDRRFSFDQNMEILNLAIKYKDLGVVGVDICGDPHSGNVIQIKELIMIAKKNGLKVTVHLGEISGCQDEISEILSCSPDRIGHGTFLSDSKEFVKSSNIPLEICLTSNLFCKTVSTIEDHHFHDFHLDDHPVILCTDDKGIFNCTLSGEYCLAAKAFNLDKDKLFQLSYRSIDSIFAPDHVKKCLRKTWNAFKSEFKSE